MRCDTYFDGSRWHTLYDGVLQNRSRAVTAALNENRYNVGSPRPVTDIRERERNFARLSSTRPRNMTIITRSRPSFLAHRTRRVVQYARARRTSIIKKRGKQKERVHAVNRPVKTADTRTWEGTRPKILTGKKRKNVSARLRGRFDAFYARDDDVDTQ